MPTLTIYAKDGAAYAWPGCTNVRQAKRELRWTNVRGEIRTMALAFIATWNTTEETNMAATFHLTDGTTIDDVTTYSTVTGTRGMKDGPTKALLDSEPHYTVFSPTGHRYVPVAQVARIETARSEARLMGWFDLPMAAGMWAADGTDLGA